MDRDFAAGLLAEVRRFEDAGRRPTSDGIDVDTVLDRALAARKQAQRHLMWSVVLCGVSAVFFIAGALP